MKDKSKIQWARWISFGVVMLIFIGIYIYVNYFLVQTEESESTSHYVKGEVVQMLQDDTTVDETTEGVLRGSQQVIVEVREGALKGKQYMTTNYLSALYNINAQVGTKVVLRMDLKSTGEYNVSIYSYDRANILYICIALFALLLCIIGGKKGFMALFGILFTLLCIWKVMLPMMLFGVPVLFATILIVILSAFATFLLVDGVNRKTICAATGTIAGVIVAGIFALIVGKLTHVTGFQTNESEELLLLATGHGMKLTNLFTAGILISALGAVMDVAMSIASAIHELKEVNKEMTFKNLFRSGMNIGRDAMGTMANTLILAFVGSSLTLILLVYTYDIPFIQLVNTDLVAREIIQGIAGSIGIVLTVPIVGILSAYIESRGEI